jgi:hypothetical protein
MRRVPLLLGSRVVTARVPDETALLSAPAPLDPIANVEAAVAEALRFPLAGPALEDAATRGGRATIVVEPPTLPFPGARDDPRRAALAAVLDELARVGVAPAKQTVLVAGGLERRAGRAELETLLPRARARDFRGRVLVHDAEDDGLREVREAGHAYRVSPALLDTDLVVTVTAAETVLHGGPAALLAAGAAPDVRAATADSLLEPSLSAGWRLASGLGAGLAREVPTLGLSLVLDHPRVAGRFSGWPWEPDAVDRIVRSRLRRAHNAVPQWLRRRWLRGVDVGLETFAALAGPPAVAHAEALIRGRALRSAQLPQPLDAIVVPLPWLSPHRPRTVLDPVAASSIGLGLALRLWRERPPLRRGGTIVLLHGLRPTFDTRPGAPHRALYEALRQADDEALVAAERDAAGDPVALQGYRAGHAPHPLQPFADREACRPMLELAGRVIVGGCRDAGAARRLGFVPSHSAQTAIDMALGVAGDGARLGVLLAPPYPPLVVG